MFVGSLTSIIWTPSSYTGEALADVTIAYVLPSITNVSTPVSYTHLRAHETKAALV